MITIKVEGGRDGIEKALKKFKRKMEKVGTLKEVRKRKEFVKPSVKNRDRIKKAIHVQKKYGDKTDNE